MLLANDNSAVLYQDEFCKLTEDILTIKRYFFGTLKPKEVRLTQIRVVYFEEQKTAAGKYAHRRVWGKGVNTAAAAEDKKIPVYWAADLRR
jgi:hypothetical protein